MINPGIIELYEYALLGKFKLKTLGWMNYVYPCKTEDPYESFCIELKSGDLEVQPGDSHFVSWSFVVEIATRFKLPYREERV